MIEAPQSMAIQFWPIDRFVSTPATRGRTTPPWIACAPASASSGSRSRCSPAATGTVVDGHLRLKAARKLGSWPGGDTT